MASRDAKKNLAQWVQREREAQKLAKAAARPVPPVVHDSVDDARKQLLEHVATVAEWGGSSAQQRWGAKHEFAQIGATAKLDGSWPVSWTELIRVRSKVPQLWTVTMAIELANEGGTNFNTAHTAQWRVVGRLRWGNKAVAHTALLQWTAGCAVVVGGTAVALDTAILGTFPLVTVFDQLPTVSASVAPGSAPSSAKPRAFGNALTYQTLVAGQTYRTAIPPFADEVMVWLDDAGWAGPRRIQFWADPSATRLVGQVTYDISTRRSQPSSDARAIPIPAAAQTLDVVNTNSVSIAVLPEFLLGGLT